MKKTDVIKDNRSLAVTTTVLVAILLISQLSLASSNIRFVPDSNYDSLKVSDAENDNDFISSTPDFETFSTKHENTLVPQYASTDLPPIYIENQSTSYSIRSPPFFLLTSSQIEPAM